MSATYRLDRAGGALCDGTGRRFDAAARVWREADGYGGASGNASRIAATGTSVDAIAAATWLQRESGHPLRVPVGVI